MIKDEKLGLKIAENPVEARWEEVRSAMERNLVNGNIDIEINQLILDYAKRKLKGGKNGSK